MGLVSLIHHVVIIQSVSLLYHSKLDHLFMLKHTNENSSTASITVLSSTDSHLAQKLSPLTEMQKVIHKMLMLK